MHGKLKIYKINNFGYNLTNSSKGLQLSEQLVVQAKFVSTSIFSVFIYICILYLKGCHVHLPSVVPSSSSVSAACLSAKKHMGGPSKDQDGHVLSTCKWAYQIPNCLFLSTWMR